MEQSSIIIHKGGKEEKYQIYVEDYVLSFLKEETGRLELSEFYFYGFKEKNGKKYMIYGAGRDERLAVFDKYDLLEEVGCRLTQAGPVFLIREKDGTKYEIKGYEIFYQNNKEMQNYLIERKKEDNEKTKSSMGRIDYLKSDRVTVAGKTEKYKPTARRTPHNTITVQLGIILVALVAIVINSTNSYDKMQELNQSAEEVLFAIENQEAEDVAPSDNESSEIIVERDGAQEEDILKLATLENEGQTVEQSEENLEGKNEEDVVRQGGEDTEEGAEKQGEDTETITEEQSNGQDKDAASEAAGGDKTSSEEEKLEALSRNVTRYYEVERGDTLYTISQKIYGDTTYVQKICELNQITNPDNIRYGQKIILP
ncbi:MAG: LysM peptidoglycan-binding domain-containing protein [Lachnospiraceae bacterium]|nr:LysM peptidoglycan-binding domain-containing protein [Lachnospiraceae bacterium]